MRGTLLILLLITSFLVSGQTNSSSVELVSSNDEIIDTIKLDSEHYIRFYREANVNSLNLDFDESRDTIVWYNYMEQSIERSIAFRDNGSQVLIKNINGSLLYSGDFSFTDEKFKKFSDTITYEKNDYIIFRKLNPKTTGLIMTHQLYGSDIDRYTIIGVNSFTKPTILHDSEFILTSLEDLDGDGFSEIIGRHPNYGVAEYALNFVPYMVLKYKDSLYIDKELTYSYNYPFKKYRDFPQGSIMLLTDEYLTKYSNDELRLMRNEIYADYGYVFNSKELNDYFLKKEWYKPKANRYIILTDWEKMNIETIKRAEEK